jgi:hypothetical protein
MHESGNQAEGFPCMATLDGDQWIGSGYQCRIVLKIVREIVMKVAHPEF